MLKHTQPGRIKIVLEGTPLWVRTFLTTLVKASERKGRLLP